MPDFVPAYGIGFLVGLAVSATLGLACLTSYLVYRRYPPIRFAFYFYLILGVYFAGQLAQLYQYAPSYILFWHRLQQVALIWLPMAWLGLAYSLLGRRQPRWVLVLLAWSLAASLATLVLDHPLALSSRLDYFAPAAFYRPTSTFLRPAIYMVDLGIVAASIYLALWQWWPRSPRPGYVRLIMLGLSLFLLSGLHDAAVSIGMHPPYMRPTLWIASVLLSFIVVVAISFHFRDLNQALASSDRNFHKAFESSPNLICITVPETGEILEMNQAFADHMGYRRQEVLGRTTLEIGLWVNPADRRQGGEQLAAHGRIRDQETRWRTGDGRERDVSVSGELITWEGHTSFLVVAEDITLRKQAETRLREYSQRLEDEVTLRTQELVRANRELTREVTERQATEAALRQSRSNLQMLFDAIGDLVLVLDHQGRVMHANLHASRRLGYSLAEMQGMSVVQLHPPEHHRQAEQMFADILARRRDMCHLPLITRRGEIIPAETKVSFGSWGGRAAILGISRDITERQRAEEGLAQLTAGVAHNFNNLMAAVMGNAQAARSELSRPRPDLGRLSRLMDNVVRSADSGRGVVGRLSALVGRGDAHSGPLEKMELAEACRSALDIAQAAFRRLGMARVRVETDLAEGLFVEARRGELIEVLLNLIKNSLEAMTAKGRIIIRARGQEGRARLTVTDNGQGMDPATMDRLFQPFFSTKGVRGQGLGLASSQGIMRSLGGAITAHSQPGVGTTFTISLPLTAPPQVQPPAPAGPAPAGELILLVEDEALVAMGLQSMLEAEGWRVDIASRVREAKLKLDERLPELLLCDLGLPDGSGWEVVAQLRELEPAQGAVPVVLLTGWAADPKLIRQPTGQPPPDAVLHKPVDQSHLVGAVARMLAQSRRRQRAGAAEEKTSAEAG